MFKKALLSILLTYTILGFFLLPYLVKSQIVKNVKTATYADISIENIYFNPYTFKFEANTLKLLDTNKTNLFSLKKLEVNIEPHSIIKGTIYIKDIIIKKPKLYLGYDGEINFSKLLKKTSNNSDSNSSIAIPRIVVDKVQIEDANIYYEDSTKDPKYKTALTNLNFKLNNIDSKKLTNSDTKFKLIFDVGDSGVVKLKSKILSFSPFVIKGAIAIEDLALYEQYKYIQENLNIELADGKISLDALYYFNDNDINSTKIDNLNISLDKLRIKPKTKYDDILNLKKISLQDITILPFSNYVDIKKISLDRVNTYASIDKNGEIDTTKYLKTKFASNDEKNDAKPLDLKVGQISLKDGKFEFYDKGLKPKVKMSLDDINIELQNIQTIKDVVSKYTLNASLNKKGVIDSSGEFELKSLKQKGILELKDISLKEFSPYIEQTLYAKLYKGEVDLKANISYEKSKTKPDISLDGMFGLKSILLKDTRDNSTLFSIDKLSLKSFEMELSPNKIYIDKAYIDSFYIDAIINKDKSMNLSTLMKKQKKAKATKTTSKTGDAFDIKVMELNLKNARAKFSDNSLPVKFKTDIHSLDGMIYAISNKKNETSYIDVEGVVDKYGSAKLKGSLDAGDIKKYLDLDFSFRNLNLNSISGYSATFAGHKIDDGRLFLDLGYEIMDSKLDSSNSIIVKNIKLGDAYKNENNTSLPLGFVIALLEDSDGVIDIEMPIKGDVDKPDFKYGALVIETFFKLIGSAVSSPFRFLGTVMGIDGDKLSSVEFEKGKSYLIPSEKEKLDNLAKMMLKKPKILLGITPFYDETIDKLELQKEKLIDIVLKKTELKNRKNYLNVISIELLEQIYKELDKDANIDEMRNIYKSELKKVLVEKSIQLQMISEDELKSLAQKRVETIIEYLVDEKSIDKNRIKTKDVKVLNNKDTNYIKIKLDIENDKL